MHAQLAAQAALDLLAHWLRIEAFPRLPPVHQLATHLGHCVAVALVKSDCLVIRRHVRGVVGCRPATGHHVDRIDEAHDAAFQHDIAGMEVAVLQT